MHTPPNRFHKPFRELMRDAAFIEHIAQQAGVSPRYVRATMKLPAFQKHFDLTASGPCQCEYCREEAAHVS
jgi:hypothetical protein